MCIGCVQKKDKIDLDGEQTVIFHVNRVDSVFYSRGVGDNEYFINPFIFKPDSTRERRIMLYQDVKNRLMPVDSFWNRWWEEKAVADIEIEADDNFSTNFEGAVGAMAITTPPTTTNKMRIIFNTDPTAKGNILSEPDVFKAVSVMHEVLHAEMYRKMLHAAKGAGIKDNTLDWEENWNWQEFQDFRGTLEEMYFGIFDYYTRYEWDTEHPTNAQHQQITQHYRETIAKALKEYDPTISKKDREDLAWIGLNAADIRAWQLEKPEEQKRIKNRINKIRKNSSNGCK